MSKPSIGRMALALPLLFFGLLPFFEGYYIVRDWASEGIALVGSGAIELLSGAIMLGSAIWLLVSLGRQRFPLWSGGIATLLSAGAIVLDRLPCSSPA
jgi:hypothetical protein